MKRFIYRSLFMFLSFFFINTINSAQTELEIYALQGTLDEIIAADQASATPADIYTLVSLDTTYIFDEGIVFNSDVEIRGVVGDDGRVPTIQPNVLSDGSIPGHLFTFTNDNSVVEIHDLYLLGVSIDNTVNWGDGFGITVNGNNIKTYINNVIFEQWGQFSINYSGDWNSFWITNCKFRNSVNTGSVYTGQAFRQRNDLGTTLTDTVVMRYNTFLAVNAYAMATSITGYLDYGEFTHNTVVGMVKNPFFSMNNTNWVVKHNIFYDVYAGGMSNGEYPWWDRIWGPGLGSVIDLDPLSKLNAALFGIDTTQANWSELAEAARTIEVTDNIYYRSPEIDAFAQSVNDTATTTADSIKITPWMNENTEMMFNDDARWPGLTAEGNLMMDPQFGSTYAEFLGAPGSTVPEKHGTGLIPYIRMARANGSVANDYFGYDYAQPDFQTTGNWVPTWPLPEFTDELLKYQADMMAADGMYYGDPFWSNGGVIITSIENDETVEALPTEFSLSNNYPNPFNPSTKISFSLPQNGNVSLMIFDVTGKEVKTVIENSMRQAGNYTLNLDMSGFSSGVYFYQISFNNLLQTKKMLLLK